MVVVVVIERNHTLYMCRRRLGAGHPYSGVHAQPAALIQQYACWLILSCITQTCCDAIDGQQHLA